MKPLRPYERYDTLKQFLEQDRRVLCFYCVWDDTGSTFGDLRELVLHYFLADDTIEIREMISPNSGRDTVSRFLRRSKLPKVRIPWLLCQQHNVYVSPSYCRWLIQSQKLPALLLLLGWLVVISLPPSLSSPRTHSV